MWKHENLLELVGVVGARYHHVVVVVYIRLKAISIMPTPSVEYTTGKRGKDNALVDGQRYTLNRKRNGTDGVTKTYWICVVPGCVARLVLHEQTVKNSPNHNHDEQRAEIFVHRSKKTMKERAATSDTSTKRIVAEVLSGLDFECRANLGCRTNSLSKMVRTARAAANRQPTNPTSLEFLSIPPSYLYIIL